MPSIVCSSFKFNDFSATNVFLWALFYVFFLSSFTLCPFSLSFALVHSFNNSFFRYSIQTLLQTSDELKVGVMPIIELYHLFNIFRAVFRSRIEIIPQNFHQYGFAILSFYSRCLFNLFVLGFFSAPTTKTCTLFLLLLGFRSLFGRPSSSAHQFAPVTFHQAPVFLFCWNNNNKVFFIFVQIKFRSGAAALQVEIKIENLNSLSYVYTLMGDAINLMKIISSAADTCHHFQWERNQRFVVPRIILLTTGISAIIYYPSHRMSMFQWVR